jgi:hypothetical protein
MKLVISGTEYPITEAVTQAKLEDLLTVEKESRELGHTVTVKRLRDYIVNDLLRPASTENGDGFTFADGEANIIAFYSLVYLARRQAGEDTAFDDARSLSIGDLRLAVTVEDEPEADPKDQTDSAPAEESDATTT